MSEDRIDIIERYLSGKMSEEEKARFTEALDTDPELRKDVDNMRLIDDALELSIENDLRRELKDLELDDSGKSTAKVRRMRVWTIAAGILVIVVAGAVLIRQTGTPSIETFSSDYYVEYNYGQVRGANAADSPLSPGIEFIDNKSWEAAATWFEEYLSTNTDDTEAKFIFADIKRQLGDIPGTKALLSSVIESESILWTEKAEWNYVLVSAFDNWDERAESLFDKISSQPSHSYYPAAQQLQELRNRE